MCKMTRMLVDFLLPLTRFNERAALEMVRSLKRTLDAHGYKIVSKTTQDYR